MKEILFQTFFILYNQINNVFLLLCSSLLGIIIIKATVAFVHIRTISALSQLVPLWRDYPISILQAIMPPLKTHITHISSSHPASVFLYYTLFFISKSWHQNGTFCPNRLKNKKNGNTLATLSPINSVSTIYMNISNENHHIFCTAAHFLATLFPPAG